MVGGAMKEIILRYELAPYYHVVVYKKNERFHAVSPIFNYTCDTIEQAALCAVEDVQYAERLIKDMLINQDGSKRKLEQIYKSLEA
jgi:hypothetical protein